jgi:signal transduction histidine kinase
MRLSIRSRLTLWYTAVVVAILLTGGIVGSAAQARLALQGVDDDLTRTMATLVGVMHTEFGEGLTLEASADEASREVVAPGHGLALLRADDTVLEAWGEPALAHVLAGDAAIGLSTRATGGAGTRVLVRDVNDAGHRYRAVVAVSLDSLAAQQTAMVRALSLGGILALLTAAVGGWLIGRKTLQPLSDMAAQASRIDGREPSGRLSTPNPDDELGVLAASFNDLLQRLATALHQQRQFMADASHELRTPVSVVRTTAQVTLSQPHRPEGEYREGFTIVEEQATRLSRLVEAMFLLSRAEAQGVPLHREFVNLDDLVAETVRAARVVAEQRALRVVVEGQQEVGFEGDDGLLRQLVANLLDNAIRHADIGGTVVAALSRDAHDIVLRVTNDGPGIAPSDQTRIFERFVRIGPSTGGGLGLPIARWIAEAHGGALTLEDSEPGRTVFQVRFPAAPVIGRSSTA